MQITIDIPDALAGQLQLRAKTNLHALLQALVEQHVSEGGLTVVTMTEAEKLKDKATAGLLPGGKNPEKEASSNVSRPRRDILARLRGIYGYMPVTGENAILAARRMERY